MADDVHCRPESWLARLRGSGAGGGRCLTAGRSCWTRSASGRAPSWSFRKYASGKSEVIEPRDSDLADELAALANSYGGVCALGVSAHPPRIVGIPPHRLNQLVEHVRRVCDELVEPGLDPTVASLSLPGTTGEDVAIVKIDVRRSLFVHRSPAGYLNRVADSKRAMSMEYLARLDRQRSHIGMVGFEQHMVPDATLEALSADLRERFRILGMGEARPDLLAQLRMARKRRRRSAAADSCWHPHGCS